VRIERGICTFGYDLVTMTASCRIPRDRNGAWRSLAAHLLWEHDAPIPNECYISTAINGLRVFHFANELDCGPICGPSDATIRCAIHCDGLQRSGPRGESMLPRVLVHSRMPSKSKLTGLGRLFSKPRPGPRIASMTKAAADRRDQTRTAVFESDAPTRFRRA